MKNILLFIIINFLAVNIITAQFYPGGVTDAEVWYHPTVIDIESNTYPNYANTDIEISNCGSMDNHLLNFNPSFKSDKLCLEYKTNWENSNSRSLFFVGEHENIEKPFSHFYTTWRNDIGYSQLPSPFIRFFVNLNSTNISGLEISEKYTPNDIAVINYYNLNNFNIDRKFRSYGQTGETSVYIGKSGQLYSNGAETLDDGNFHGNFAEAISFTRELSKNERNRVESYLAIKYGVTLETNDSYKSSSNINIWNQDNFNLFPKRVFGLGRDSVSHLRQYQSQSVQEPNFLIAAIEEIEDNNTIKQDAISIDNNHFLVFGDNGNKTNLSPTNDKGFAFWERVWLAQRTGSNADRLPIYFKIKLTSEIQEVLVSDPRIQFWLLKDKDADGSDMSNFSGAHIEYYPAVLNLLEGTATFENVFFDTDDSKFDQFTFGLGSEIVVQVTENGCGPGDVPLLITISGGTPPYNIEITNGQNTENIVIGDQQYIYSAIQAETYSIYVTDSSGISAPESNITVDSWDFIVNLGPDLDMASDNGNIILDGGANIPDPNATYQWFKNNVLLEVTSSTLSVVEPGTYKVIVTSEDLTCQVEDEIIINPKEFVATITTQAHCFELFNSINIEIVGGQPNFTTVLTKIDVDPVTSITYTHIGNLEITDLEEGDYTITITDSWDYEFQEAVTIYYEPINLDIHSQLELYCDPSDCLNTAVSPAEFNPADLDYFSLDASQGITQAGISYEWFMDNVPIQIGPYIAFDRIEIGDSCDQETKEKTIKVVATNELTNCNEDQSFKVNGFCLSSDITPLYDPIVNNTDDVNDLKALEAIVYPNPNKHNTVFIFEVFSTEIFNGVVEIFTLEGKALIERTIEGEKRYALPFSLRTTGTYLIKVTTEDNTVLTKRVIIE